MPHSDPITSVVVLGAGTMGAGIAQVCALAGLRTLLSDVDERALSQGIERIHRQIEDGVRRGKVAEAARDAARAALAAAPDLEAAARQADLVVEAAPERIELKKDLFAKLSRLCPPEAILATNTSSLSITAIASAATNPGRVIGLHFFNPPHIMKLLEVVVAGQTSDATLAAARQLAVRLGKTAIVVKDSPGFATSRLGLVLGLEAMRMLEQEVASAEDIDRAMELGYGHPMGPLRVSDLVGLDVRLAIAEILHHEVGETFRPPEILRRLVKDGKLGKKTGEGFHRWDDTPRT